MMGLRHINPALLDAHALPAWPMPDPDRALWEQMRERRQYDADKLALRRDQLEAQRELLRAQLRALDAELDEVRRELHRAEADVLHAIDQLEEMVDADEED